MFNLFGFRIFPNLIYNFISSQIILSFGDVLIRWLNLLFLALLFMLLAPSVQTYFVYPQWCHYLFQAILFSCSYFMDTFWSQTVFGFLFYTPSGNFSWWIILIPTIKNNCPCRLFNYHWYKEISLPHILLQEGLQWMLLNSPMYSFTQSILLRTIELTFLIVMIIGFWMIPVMYQLKNSFGCEKVICQQ